MSFEMQVISNTPLIGEEEFETALWLKENLPELRDKNLTYDRIAIDPFKAAPFSSVSGLYISFSSMHPLLRYEQRDKMIEFLENNCTDTNFLQRYKISVVYNPDCENNNLTKIYPNVYILTN